MRLGEQGRVESLASNTYRIFDKTNGPPTVIATCTATSTTSTRYDIRMVCEDAFARALRLKESRVPGNGRVREPVQRELAVALEIPTIFPILAKNAENQTRKSSKMV